MDAIDTGNIKNTGIRLIVSSREGAYGLERAGNRGIPCIVIPGRDTEGLLNALSEHSIDGIVLAGYLSILPPEVIDEYSGRIINIHPALLPLFGGKGFYGIKVHQAVLASGFPFTGATAHIVDSGIDTGAALVRGAAAVLPGDTAESLQKRVLELEHPVLVKAVKALVEGRITELVEKPLLLINNCDRDALLKYAAGLSELGAVLTEAGRTNNEDTGGA